MAKHKNMNPDDELQTIAKGNLDVWEQLTHMLEGSYEESGLDPETFMLVRLAALAAMDAAPTSWLVNIKIGKELGISRESAVGALIAVAPIIGTARVVSAAGSILTAIDLDEQMNKSTQKAHRVHH